MKKLLMTICSFLLLCATANATLLTGSIDDLSQGTAFSWGDGSNNLTQKWSNTGWYSGYVYGSDMPTFSNADIYVYTGLSDPTTVTDASSFSYQETPLRIENGDTVFFRGTNGYYGAWQIENIDNDGPNFNYSLLNGQWYFQDDGTGNFSDGLNSAVPVPSTLLLLGSGLLGVAGVSRRKN